MVEPSDYDKYEQELRAKYAKDGQADAAQKDEEYRDLLERIGTVVGVTLRSFDDLPTLEAGIVERHIAAIAQTIGTDKREDARHYAVESLLGGDAFYSGDQPPFSYETLRVLFDSLPRSTSDDDYTKDLVANAMNTCVKTFTPAQTNDFLSMFTNNAYKPTDLAILYLGLENIKDRSYDGAIQAALVRGLQYPRTLWTCADVARKKHYTPLLPHLQKALNLTDDREIQQVIQKAIDTLSK